MLGLTEDKSGCMILCGWRLFSLLSGRPARVELHNLILSVCKKQFVAAQQTEQAVTQLLKYVRPLRDQECFILVESKVFDRLSEWYVITRDGHRGKVGDNLPYLWLGTNSNKLNFIIIHLQLAVTHPPNSIFETIFWKTSRRWKVWGNTWVVKLGIMCKVNKRGPRTESCGTPQFKADEADSPPTNTDWARQLNIGNKPIQNHPRTAKCGCSLSVRIPWSMVSKAADSQAMTIQTHNHCWGLKEIIYHLQQGVLVLLHFW